MNVRSRMGGFSPKYLLRWLRAAESEQLRFSAGSASPRDGFTPRHRRIGFTASSRVDSRHPPR
jgi:hypothetical protein